MYKETDLLNFGQGSSDVAEEKAHIAVD